MAKQKSQYRRFRQASGIELTPAEYIRKRDQGLAQIAEELRAAGKEVPTDPALMREFIRRELGYPDAETLKKIKSMLRRVWRVVKPAGDEPTIGSEVHEILLRELAASITSGGESVEEAAWAKCSDKVKREILTYTFSPVQEFL